MGSTSPMEKGNFERGRAAHCKVQGRSAVICCNKSSALAEIGDRLATVDMGRKVGGCCVPFRGRGDCVPI